MDMYNFTKFTWAVVYKQNNIVVFISYIVEDD